MCEHHLGLGPRHINFHRYCRLPRRNLRCVPDRWRCLLLERHVIDEGMGPDDVVRGWLADTGGKLDGHPEHYLLRGTVDSQCYLVVERGFRGQCLADHPHVLGGDLVLRDGQYLLLPMAGYHQQGVHLLDRGERGHHLDYAPDHGGPSQRRCICFWSL